MALHDKHYQSFFERLEDRVLFDGVPDATFVSVPTDQFTTLVPEIAQPSQSQAALPTELIIIDANVQDNDVLLQSLIESKPSTAFTVHILDVSTNGVEQITDFLDSSNSQFEAVHILSHGSAGNVQLGNTQLNTDNVGHYVDELASWASALTQDADLLFYGCELAFNADGQSLIQTVSAVTGADVAASTDVTGNETQTVAADWQLEFSSGQVEAIALSATTWSGTLAVEATNGAVTIQDAENSGAGTITLTNNGSPEVVTVLNTPTRVGQMLERVWQFNETADTGRATYVFDVSGIAGINATIASEFGLIVSDQPDLADGPNTTTLVASGYDAANGLVYFHQVDLNSGDYFGLATEVVQDNYSVFPTATGLEDNSIDLGLTLSPSLTQGGQLQDIIATDTGFRAGNAGTTTTDFFIPAGTTGIRIAGFSTRDIGTAASDLYNDDYQFLNVSIDLGSETSNGYIGHIIDQGPARSDQFGFNDAPLGSSILTGGGTIVGDANDNIDPTFSIVDGVLMIEENHQLQTAYHVEYLTNATSSAEFIRTSSAVLQNNDQSLATLNVPANTDFLVVNITDAAAGSNSRIEYKGNSRVYIDLATLQASGVVAAEIGETDTRVVAYGFEDYDVSSVTNGSIISGAGTIVGDTMGLANVINDNQIYFDASGNLVIDRDNSFAGTFNSLITVEYYERRPFGSSAEQLGEATDYGFWNSDPSNPTSTLEFDIPDNATLGILNLTQNGTNTNDTNENSGAAFAVIDLANGTSSGSIYFVRAGSRVDLVGWDATPFGTAFFDDPNSISNHTTINQFVDPFAGTATFNLINGGTTLELAVNSDSGGTQSFLDYYAGGQVEWYGAAPFEVSGSVAGGSFSQGTLNPVTGNYELTIAQAAMGLSYIPPTHVSGTVPVDVTLRIGDETETTAVTIQAVIDPISFAGIPDACGDEDTDIPITANITPTFVDQDGSETLTSQVLSNIPIGHTLTDGTNTFVSSAGSQSVDITAWNSGTLTYRANPDESGTFTITMDVNWQDVGGGVTDTDSMQTTFDVIVKPINDPPVAVDDFYTVLGNTTLTTTTSNGVLINDSDPESDPLTVNTTPLSGPSNGTLTLNSDGTFTYTPNSGFSGPDSFDYEISDGNGGTATATAFIDVSEPVTGPLEAMDDAVTTNEETLINIAVMANDDLPTTGAFNIQSTTPPSNGVITVLPDGTIDYTPDMDFFGTDTFTYTLADASGRTSTATVTVTVLNVQDPPVANADSGSTPEDTTLPNINILSNDSDPDNDPLTVTTAVAANGTVVINADGTIDYTPNPGFNGTDTVNYTISDGNGGTASSIVLINVVPVADPPTSADNTVKTDEEISYTFVASDFAFADQDVGDSLVTVRIDTLPGVGQLLINGNPAMAGQVVSLNEINNGNVIFVPAPDGNGTGYATFDFSVSDGILYQTTPNTMTIDVCPIQDPPVATDNAITVNEDSTANPLGLATPTDVDGDTLTATVTGLPIQGVVYLADGVTVVNNGDMLTMAQLTSLVYDAPAVFTGAGAGSFTYDVTDGIDTDSGQVDITIVPVNDPPYVDLDTGTAGEDYADTFTEGGAPVRIADLTVDVTDEDDIRVPFVKIDVDASTIVDAGDEFLVIGGVDFQLDAAANSTTTINIGTDYDVTFTAATGRFDIVRTDGLEMTLGQAEVVLRNTFYRNDSVLPTVGDRVFDVCTNDGDVDSNTATSVISVVRDATAAQWSITGAASVIDGNSATYSVALSDPLRSGETASVDLGLMDIDTTSADYGPLNAAINAAVAAYTGPGTLSYSGTTLTFTSDGTGAMAPLSIVLPTTPDSVYEGDEDYKITLSNPASTTGETITIDAAADEVVTTIIDNTPAPTVMITGSSSIEGNPVRFRIDLDLASVEDIVLDLSVASGSATAGADFETSNFEFFDGVAWQPAAAGTQVTLPAGTTSLDVRVDSVQELLVEPDETFTMSATVLSGTVTNSSDTGTGTIINDDVANISINDVTVDEDNGTMTFTVSLDQPSVTPVSVDFATANGAATGADFTAASGTVNFASGVQTQTVTIAITQDNIYEGPHSFDVNLSNPTGGTIVDGLGIGTIIDDGTGPNSSDDDRPILSVDNVTSTETVDTHAVFTVSLSNPSVQNTHVSLALVNGTATSGADFGPGLEFFNGTAWQAVTGNITIPAGSTAVEVRTPIIDDPIADNNETYSLVATRVTGTTFNTSATGTGTILDDADPTLVNITGPASVTEGNSAVYNIALTNTPITPVALTFTYTGTANNGTDYTGVATISIPAGSTTGTVTIPTINDTLGEPLENFTISINSATGGSFENFQIDPTAFQVTTDIVDDDVPAISVNDVVVSEGADPFAEFTVELSNPTYETIAFSIAAMSVSASGETVDFGILGLDELEVFDGTNWVPATSASFAPGDTTILMRTPITDDAFAEGIETFTVTVTTTAGTTSNPSDTGTGTIQDDTSDPETVLVSLLGPPSVVEGSTTTNYTVDLTAPSGLPINAAEDVTVTFAYTGVAADGSDYTALATIVIPAGSASATFTLPTVNDSLYEGSEDIIITIDSVSGGGFEGIGADPTADSVTTLITDAADIPTVAINDVTSVEGTDNFARFNVTLSNLSVEDIDVSLALASGTATGAGVDFGAAGAGNLQIFNGTTWVDAATATILAGDSIAEFRVPITDDLIDEPTENYTLTVDVTAGTTTNIQVIGTGTIIDDDPAPDVTIADATASEGDPVVFDVTLSNPSSQAIVLDFAASDTTATAATDYNATAFEYSTDSGATWIPATGGSQATIPAGSTAIQVRVLTTEDVTLETTETMELAINGVVSGLVGNTTDTAVGTIIDDDSALVSIVANDPIACEPTDHGQFTVSMTNPSDTATVIAYAVTGSATSGVDFAALSGTITLPAGTTSDTIDLTVIDDTIVEGIEDVTITLTSIVSGDADISIDAASSSDTATIKDDDNASWALTGDTTVNEGADATYNLTLNGTLQSGESTAVDLVITDTTTTPADYASFNSAVAAAVAAYAGPGTVTWDGTAITFTSDGTGQMAPLVIDLMAVNDAIVEGTEQYNVAISGATSATGIAVGIDAANNSVDTEIQDTIDAVGTSLDKASWSITGATSVNEASTTNYTITIDATLQALEVAEVDISLTNIDTSNGDATGIGAAVVMAVVNYNASGQPGTLAFNGTTLSFTSDGTGPMGDLIVQITANADGILEGPEDYSVQLTNPNSTTGACVVLDTNDSVTTTINPSTTAAEWSIGVDNSGDEGSTVSYDVQLTQAFGAGDSATVDLALNDVDTNSTDYGNFVTAVNDAILVYTGPGTLTFDGTTLTFTATADGDMMTGLTIDLDLIDDPIVEGVETFTVDLSNPAGPTGINVAVSTTDDSVTTTIIDTIGAGGSPDIATWSVIGPAAGDEGTSAQYTVELDGALGAGESVSVVLSLTDVDTTSGDYASIIAAASAAAAANPDVTFDPVTGAFTYTAPSDGAMMADLVIDLGLATDAIAEGPEDFEIAISSATSTTGAAVTIDGTADIVTTTINDLTAPLEWAITGPPNVDEGATAQYTVTLGGALGAGETASVVIGLSDLTTNPNDYADIHAAIALAIGGNPNLAYDPATGTLTFTSPTDGATMPPVLIDLGIVNDAFVEGSEFLTIGLSNSSSTTGAATTVSTTDNLVTTEIFDTQGAGLDPDQAVWSITGDTMVAEGATAQYTVALDGQFGAGEVATVELGIANVDTANADYLDLIAATNAAVAAYAGPGTVTFDGTTITFTAANDGDVMSDLVIDLGAVDDVITEGDEDYTISVLNPGSTTGGTIFTDNTSRIVTTTIKDNDNATWSITGDATVGEGNDAKYAIALAGTLQSGETSTIDLTIGDNDTTSADYANFVAAVNAAITNYTGPGSFSFDGTTLTFTSDGNPMGDLCIELTAINDTLVEGPEDYTVSIANPASTTGSAIATAGTTTVTTTITDNDVATWSITGDATVGEGNDAKYNVALTGTLQSGETASIDLAVGDVDTTSADYANFVAAVNTAITNYTGPGSFSFDGTTLTFTSDGNPMDDLCIEPRAINDTLVEGPEDYTVSIANPGSTTGSAIATGGTTTVTTTITDNDVATWSITGDAAVGEGNDAKYNVALAGTLQSGEIATIDLGVGDVDTTSADYANFVAAVNTAITNYTGPGSFSFDGTTLTFTSDGNPMDDLCIELTAIDDAFVEGPQNYTVSIANPGTTTGSAIATGGPITVTTTITDNDSATWSITGDTMVDEGATAQYTVALDGQFGAGEVATVELGIANIDTANTDYLDLIAATNAAVAAYAGPGTVTFDGTTITFTAANDGDVMSDLVIDLGAVDDVITEGDEDYTISVLNPGSTTGGTIFTDNTSRIVTTTIKDNDTATWSITGDATVGEGNDAKYAIALAGTLQSGETSTIDLTIGDNDTTSADYANFVAAVNAAITNYTGPGSFSFDGTTLTFTSDGNPMGDLCIELTAINDTLVEGPEDYTVSIANPASTTGSAIATAGTTTVTTTITDNDVATWSITGNATVGEGNDAKYNVALAGTLQSGETASIDLAVGDVDTTSADYANFVAAVSTAITNYTGPGSFSFDGTKLTFTSDGNPMDDLCIELRAINDTLVEGSEDYTISIANPGSTTGSAIATGGPTTVTTTITDNDAVTWSITGFTGINEGDDPKYVVELDGALQAGETATIELAIGDIDTTSADYSNFVTAVSAAIAGYTGPGSLSFDGTTLTFTSDGNPMDDLCIELTAIDDAFIEGPQNFTVSIANPGSTTGSAVATGGTTTVTTTIIDNDSATWSITGDMMVDEGATAQYTVALDGQFGAGEIATVELGIANVDTANTDYLDLIAATNAAVAAYVGPGTVTFDGTTITFTAANNGDVMSDLVIDLGTVDDVIAEGDEDYTVSVLNPGSTSGGPVFTDNTSRIVTTTIKDDDTVTWSISGDPIVNEGASAKYTLALGGTLQSGETATIDLAIGDIDTTSADYANLITSLSTAVAGYSGPGTLILSGVSTLTFTSDGAPMDDLCIELAANDDTIIEGSEDYTVSILNPGSTTGSAVITGGPTTVTTTIIDNETTTWSISGDATVGEGSDAKYVVALSGTLQSGETATIDLAIANTDTTSADYANFIAAVNAAVAGYTGPGALTFDGTTLSFTSDGGPMDDLCIELTAIDDAITEGDESYSVSILNPATTTGSAVATGGPTTVTTTITDNDTATWSINGDATVAEGADAKYVVALAGTLQSGETATIDLGIGNVDTTSADYANFVVAVNTAVAAYSGPGALTFDGTTLTFVSDGNPMDDLCIELRAINDAFVEGPEDYTVSILNPGTTTGSPVVTGGSTTVTTSITDSDTATWSISGDASVSEGADAKYIVALAGTLQSGETATIDLNISDNSTTSADYANFVTAVNTAIAGYTGTGSFSFDGTTLTFTSDGNPMVDLCIELTAIDDVITEGSENYNVGLSNPGSSTAASTTLAADSVLTTIVDNDAVQWSIMGDVVVDEGGTAQYMVSLSGILQSGENSSVELALSDLETNSADYDTFLTAVQNAVASRTDLAFDATTGTLTATGTGAPMADLIINLDAVDDTLIEGVERYQVLLSNATSTSGSVTGIDPVKNTVTTTIQDTAGDGGPAEAALWSIGVDQTVPEGNPAAYTLNLAGNLQAGEIVTVDVKLSDVDTIGTDYGSLDSAITLAVATYTGPGNVAWDGTTLTFTSAGTGPMDPLPIVLSTVNDSFAEGAEDFLIALCNSNSLTGAANAIDTGADDVVTTIDDTIGPGADDVVWTIAGDNSVDEGGAATYTVAINNALASGDDATVELSIGDIDTSSADYAGFNGAVVAAVTAYNSGGNPGSVAWDGTTLTFTAAADGDRLTGLVIDLGAIDDPFLEGPEVYDVTLTGAGSNTGIVVAIDPTMNTVLTTINDTDGDGGPAEPGGEWSITGPAAVTEGDPITFTIALTGNLQSGESTTVQFSTSDIETNGADYSNVNASVNSAVGVYNSDPANPGTLTWDGTFLTFVSDGSGPMNNLDVTFSAIDDLLIEGDERLNLALSNPSSATGLSPTVSATQNIVTTTIVDNDNAQWSVVGPVMTGEGSTADYTVALDGVFQAGEVVSVDIGLTDIDTTGGDYGSLIAAINAAVASNPDLVFDSATGTLTYTAPADGASMADLVIQLPISADGVSEAPEDYVIGISNPSSSTGLWPTVDPAADDVVTTINGSPVTNPDDYFTNVDTPFVGNVLTNDSDPDGDLLTVLEVDGQPIGTPIVTDCGTVEMNPNGSFTFTPFPGFSGVDVFEYTVVDQYGNEQIETVTITVNKAEIGSAKSVSDAVPNGDDFDVTFTIVVGNLGNVALDNLTVYDDVAAKFGPALVATGTPAILNTEGIGTPPTINPAWNGDTSQNMITGGVLQPGASFQITFTVTIDPDAVGAAAGLGNQATVSGQGINPDGSVMTDSSGNPVIATDDSDSGTDPSGENGNEGSVDGIPGNDVTDIVIADLGVAKAIAGSPDLLTNGNYLVTFSVVVENTGTADLASLSLQEDLASQFGGALVGVSGLQLTTPTSNSGSNIALNTPFDGAATPEMIDSENSVLVVGDSFTLQFSVEIDPTNVAGSIGNQISATAGAIDSSGNPLLDSSGNPILGSDLSDSGTDPSSTNAGSPDDTGSSADITSFTPPTVPLGEISGTVFVDSNNNGVFDFGENGIAGVEINLIGTDVYGNAVDLTVLTDAAGNYTFENLVAGVYDVAETQPDQYSDGIDSSNAAASIGNDQLSGISLGFGESLQNNNFGELQTGTSGNPARLPLLPRFNGQRLSDAISGYLGGPGPIYSGVPIASNANPLSLESGRAVTGGYATEFAEAPCAQPCATGETLPVAQEVDSCEDAMDTTLDAIVDESIITEGIFQEIVSEEVVSTEVVECPTCTEEAVACETCDECSNCCGCCGEATSVHRRGVLLRLKNWLQNR